MDRIFFSPGDSHTKGLLVLLHLVLEGIIEVDTDLKGLCPFIQRVTPSNHRVLGVYVPSGYNNREQLARVCFFEGLQNYMKNKNEVNENKVILGDFNCTMNKMERDGENKTQRLYRYCSNYALSKLIVDNAFEDQWRRENPDSPGQVSDIKIANNTKNSHIMVSFTIMIMLFLLTDSPQKLKLEKFHGTLMILFYVSRSSPQLQRLVFFIKKSKKQPLFSK